MDYSQSSYHRKQSDPLTPSTTFAEVQQFTDIIFLADAYTCICTSSCFIFTVLAKCDFIARLEASKLLQLCP
jgi:hypothetical protein